MAGRRGRNEREGEEESRGENRGMGSEKEGGRWLRGWQRSVRRGRRGR